MRSGRGGSSWSMARALLVAVLLCGLLLISGLSAAVDVAGTAEAEAAATTTGREGPSGEGQQPREGSAQKGGPTETTDLGVAASEAAAAEAAAAEAAAEGATQQPEAAEGEGAKPAEEPPESPEDAPRVPGVSKKRAKELEPAEALFQQGLQAAEAAVNAKELEAAFALFLRAAESGHPGAQEECGLRLLNGLGAKQDVQRAVLYLYFAAQANQTAAQLALAHRHQYGLGVPKSCQAAVLYYSVPAERVVAATRTTGQFPIVERVRLSVDHDAQWNPSREQEMIQYFQYSADMGNVDAQAAIGQLFNRGSRGMAQDHGKALHYFAQAAAAGDIDASAHLGHLYANGLGVKPNNETALELFQKGAEKDHAHALYGLGYMHLAGAGVPKNIKLAMTHFARAADLGSADAHFHLAVIHVSGMGGKVDYARAFQHFNTASQAGHLLATYNLALMHLTGLGIPMSCPNALALLKSVSERGPWSAVLLQSHAAYLQGDLEGALRGYLRAAEMGMEVSQANAAYLLERRAGDADEVARSSAAAMHYHQRAADQGNVQALLRIGDAHFYGRGTPVNYNKSVAMYRQATQLRSPQAMFNLAIMHEHGWGLAKDLHLAKRYYDMAKATHPDALVPVTLAKLKLSIHSWYESNKEEVHSWWRLAEEVGTDSVLIGLLCVLAGVVSWRRTRERRARAAAATAAAAAAAPPPTPPPPLRMDDEPEPAAVVDAAAVSDGGEGREGEGEGENAPRTAD